VSFREFEYADGKSFKFWKIELDGNEVVTRYGRIGSEGQETRKDFGSPEKAQKEYDKLVAEKLRKGYMEKTAAGKTTAAAPAKAGGKTSAKKEKAGAAAKSAAGDAPGTASAGGAREFEYADGKSFKFWKIELDGNDVVTRYGRIGSEGQETRKDFGSPEKAQKEYDKLVSEKLRKGYVEKTAAGAQSTKGAKTSPAKTEKGAAAQGAGGELSPMLFSTTRDGEFQKLSNFIGERVTDFRKGKPTKGKTVFRVGLSYEDEEEGEGDFGELLGAFLASDAAAATRGLIIGAYDLEGGSTGNMPVGEIVKGKDRLPNLKALFLGDILQEECEISWINQSDISGVLEAFPQLEMLRLRGAEGLAISKPQHAGLRALAIESGGLPAKVVSQICRGKFPNLEYLELWLGTEGYGGDARVNDLQPILNGKLFPKLTYLGLRNAEIVDDIAAVIVKSPVVDQLEILDLSLGNLGDVGANALLQLESKSNLKRLDLHHHYISKPVQKKLKQLPFPVDLSDAKTVEEDDEFGGRFISVSE
jgi:predicted DNA-binding WGR domain protein